LAVDKRRSRHRLCLVFARLLVLAVSVLLSCSLLNMRPTDGSGRGHTSEPAASLDPDAPSNGDGDADTGSEAIGSRTTVGPLEPAAGATPVAAVPPGGGRHHTSELFRPPRSTPSR
jgi:hypothetical protein